MAAHPNQLHEVLADIAALGWFLLPLVFNWGKKGGLLETVLFWFIGTDVIAINGRIVWQAVARVGAGKLVILVFVLLPWGLTALILLVRYLRRQRVCKAVQQSKTSIEI